MNKEIKRINIVKDREYLREELKTLFEENKSSMEYNSYYEKGVKCSFGFLEQHKEILVKNYPFGFSLRTTIKYWIEVTKRGSRFCSQTINPKTGLWCKPKKSTYDALKFLVIDNTGKVTTLSLDYNDDKSKIKLFIDLFKGDMSDQQKIEFSKVAGYSKVMENVTFECKKQYFKHRETGEIMDSVNMFDLNKVDKCTKEGVLIDEEKENKQKLETEKKINTAIINQASLIHKGVQ